MIVMPKPADYVAVRKVVHLNWSDLEPFFATVAAQQGRAGRLLPCRGINPESGVAEYLAILNADDPDGDCLLDQVDTFVAICQFVIEHKFDEPGLIQVHQQGDQDGDVRVYLIEPSARPCCPVCNSTRVAIREETGSITETIIRQLPGLVRHQRCTDCDRMFLYDYAKGEGVDIWS